MSELTHGRCAAPDCDACDGGGGPVIVHEPPAPLKLRTGRTVGRTLYRQVGAEPSDDDQLIGVMDTPELAAMVVAAVNAAAECASC